MNQLDELLRSTLDQHAQDAPPAAPVVGRVLERERPRRHRTGWLATAAVATATAAVVAVGVTQLGGEDGAPDRGTGPAAMFTERQVTYAEGSTIHYGGESIDVSPHEVVAFVPTDDGFVFADQDRNVLFTDGEGAEQIGQLGGGGADRVLAADATGSYAAWLAEGEVVVYDTASGGEALRVPVPGDVPVTAVALDGNHAYVSNGTGVDDWVIEDQTKTSFTRPGSYNEIGDAANGYLLWDSGVVSRDPVATDPVFGKTSGMDETHLSPDGKYVASYVLFNRRTHEDITPDIPGRLGPFAVIVQWLDDDRYVADTQNILTSFDPGPHDLLTCSVSAGSCQVAAESLRAITYPNGIAPESAWQG